MVSKAKTLCFAVAGLLAACSTSISPAEPEGESLRSRVHEVSTPCADLPALRLAETSPVRRALLDSVEYACALPIDDVTLAAANQALEGNSLALTAKGDTLTLYQRAEGRTPTICCSLQNIQWTDLGDGQTYVARFRLNDLQSGMLRLTGRPLDQPLGDDAFIEWRGPLAPAEPQIKAEIEGSLTERTLFSPELDETRKLIIYEPRNGIRRERPLPVVIMADGDALHHHARIIEPLIDAGKIEPVLIVGIVSGQNGIMEDRSALGWDIRALDYLPVDLPGFPPNRFDAHLAFVTDTLIPWVESEYGALPDRSTRAVTGSSNGGVFALHAGFRRPDIFGHAWPMSIGAGTIETAEPVDTLTARFRISAGYYEAYFLGSSQTSAKALDAAGYVVNTRWYAAGHMNDQWKVALVENLKAVFPGPNATAE